MLNVQRTDRSDGEKKNIKGDTVQYFLHATLNSTALLFEHFRRN